MKACPICKETIKTSDSHSCYAKTNNHFFPRMPSANLKPKNSYYNNQLPNNNIQQKKEPTQIVYNRDVINQRINDSQQNPSPITQDNLYNEQINR